MTPRTPISRLNLPLEQRHTYVAKSRMGWPLIMGLVCLIIIIEITWLTQSYWLRKTVVRQLVNPVIEPMNYTLRRPLLTEQWEISRLAVQVNEQNNRIWQGQAVLAHHAEILQPWPTLNLTFRDWQGNAIATGQLQPHQYLPDSLPKRYSAHALIAYQEPVVIEFAVRLPIQPNGATAAVEQVELRAIAP